MWSSTEWTYSSKPCEICFKRKWWSIKWHTHLIAIYASRDGNGLGGSFYCCVTLWVNTVKPVLSGHSKIDTTKVLMTNGGLMKVESTAECSLWSILQYFWPALCDNRSWKPILIFLSGRLRQVLLYIQVILTKRTCSVAHATPLSRCYHTGCKLSQL